MNKWQYMIVTVDVWEGVPKSSNEQFLSEDEMLEKLGNEGWELVTAIPIIEPATESEESEDDPYTTHVYYYFKKPKTN